VPGARHAVLNGGRPAATPAGEEELVR